MKFTPKFAIAAMASVSLAACSQADAPAEDGATEAAAWGYGDEGGPATWGDLSEDYAACKTGMEQSPIDLPAASADNQTVVSTNYAATEAKVKDKDGKTIQADFGEGFTLTSGDSTYNLVQVHMHTPSENTIEGKAFPLTGHFVHADEAGALAVLGVMFEEGDANPAIQAMIDNVGGTAEMDLTAMLPAELSVYNFAGSLTTPPCSEGVNWHVVSTPVSASAEQIKALSDAMGNNARPVQPLNDREI